MSKLLTISDILKKLGCSRYTWNIISKRHKIKFVASSKKLNSKRYYSEEEVNRVLKAAGLLNE